MKKITMPVCLALACPSGECPDEKMRLVGLSEANKNKKQKTMPYNANDDYKKLVLLNGDFTPENFERVVMQYSK